MTHNPGFERLVEKIRSRVSECRVREVKDWQDRHEPFHFLDVREDHEWMIDHAQGAVHLGRGILERDIETLIPDKNAKIVLYCGGGYRSVLAAMNLMEMGYTRVASMEGGIKAWRQAGFPVEPGPNSL
ncbi:rhodanese-like domain-containing protein [Candidatus Nitronereus thalassa]|uniref:Rhodanese-like domain-containing protein n=1 Tax=Candidatus Nitronereus thalassa TaxID=3020898 RepID=A0ABU3KC96_9BACT|nr:rhodanese-like domain-containing protein [Candidatus Nitronereus thalassa]MDT7044013.1 rhodanese-like domain-containing protein [Candidatus Nitronereus thalassa]